MNGCIRRFLLHVPPTGYTRIRRYGLMAPSNVDTKLVLARRRLAAADAPSPTWAGAAHARRPHA